MAFIDCHFCSETLGLQTAMHVLLPQRSAGRRLRTDRQGRFPTLYLLHGLSDDHTIWLRRTSIERYADEKGIAVVMPAAGRSYFQDMAFGLRYWTFIADEVPRVARAFFPLSAERRFNYVAGLSMGGYGAFRVALARPAAYAAAASYSGALDIASRMEAAGRDRIFTPAELTSIVGRTRLAGSPSDLFALARRAARGRGPKPRLYQYCGRQDFLYADNLKFRDHLWKLKWDLTYVEDDGSHAWGFWDEQVRRTLEWLP